MTGHEVITGDWSYPTRVRFGPGRIRELAEACAEAGMARPLMVTDAGLAETAMIGAALAACRRAGLGAGLFAEVAGNPGERHVLDGVAAYRRGGHDGVIGFGGGSAMDVGKAVALMVGQSRSIFDFEDRADWWTRADGDAIAPVVAVPTTAGTGSEVGRAAAITDPRDATKKIVFHPRMMPKVVIADPALTVGLPPDITAWTGMDALSHSLEALCAPGFHPIADGVALEGIRLVHLGLEAAVRDGGDLAARARMLAAASMGAAAFQKGLGAMHALSHPCGAVLNTHHGLTNAVVMPYVLAFNRAAIEDRMAGLARYLDLPGTGFAAVLDRVLALRAGLGIPHRLADLGVGEAHVERFAAMAAIDPSAATNPVPLTPRNLATLYRDCIAGRL